VPTGGDNFPEIQTPHRQRRRNRWFVSKNFRQFLRPNPALAVRFPYFVFTDESPFASLLAQLINADRPVFATFHAHDPLFRHLAHLIANPNKN